MRDPRYDVLFEPVKIGPVTAKNRFYQVPHCNGGGYRDPTAAAEMRRVKSEGGWGVIFTEQVEIHHSSEITPFIELRIWDEDDMPGLTKMADAIHSNGALAGIELAYSGTNGPNLYTREVPMGPMHSPILTFTSDPVQARAMDKQDIKNLRHWHKLAYGRAKRAGYDIMCLYGAHGFGILQHFLSRRTNQRSDEYGGSLENRARLLKELLSDARDEVGDSCAVAVRLSLDEMAGEQGFSNAELRDLIGLHAELPDIWDFAHGTWEACSGTSRFKPEGAQEDLIRGIKQLTSRPVVGVGRFTSPDLMVRQIKQGILDFIGAARPSIADPFLPQKIRDGHLDDIRECIGCNICYAGDARGAPIRCTQNPAMGEEWRRGWHPEHFGKASTPVQVLVVGAGPAGLEAAHVLGKRGHQVMLAEAGDVAGGRVIREAALPGLSEWKRVADYRLHQISKLANVEVFRGSSMTADDVIATGARHVILATGSRWRADGRGRHHPAPQPGFAAGCVLTPDDIMAGKKPEGPVVIFDDDGYYMASVIAELLASQGHAVAYVTTAGIVSEWSVNTAEQSRVQARLIELGVEIIVSHAVVAADGREATLACVFTGRERRVPCGSLVSVTSRQPDDTLWHELQGRDHGLASLSRIGDCKAPGLIAMAVHDGHLAGRMLGEDAALLAPKRERVVVGEF